MNIALNHIRTLVTRLAPEALCDTCIAARVDEHAQPEVPHLVRELVGQEGFELVKQPCALCCETSLSIRKSARGVSAAGQSVWASSDQRRRA